MRADQGLFLKGFLVTMSNSAVIPGSYTVNSSFHLFFLKIFLMFLVTMSTRALIVGVYSRYSVFTLSFPNLSLRAVVADQGFLIVYLRVILSVS